MRACDLIGFGSRWAMVAPSHCLAEESSELA